MESRPNKPTPESAHKPQSPEPGAGPLGKSLPAGPGRQPPEGSDNASRAEVAGIPDGQGKEQVPSVGENEDFIFSPPLPMRIQREGVNKPELPPPEKESGELARENEEFFRKWAKLIDPPPLGEDFHKRLMERLKKVSQGEQPPQREGVNKPELPPPEKESGELARENYEFFKNLAELIDPPPLGEDFHKRLSERLKQFPQNPKQEK